jgi:hypothetical protein
MVKRYSLYGDYNSWSGNIQEDPEGQWLKWKDTESYVQYALAHGYVPPTIELPTSDTLAMMIVDRLEGKDQLDIFNTTTHSLLPEELGEFYDQGRHIEVE